MPKDYKKYLRRSFLDKAINGLTGIIEGISLDGMINPKEIVHLSRWVESHKEYANCHPFNELLPAVANAAYDGKITPDERAELAWLCENLRSTEFHDEITADIQHLQSILGAIASDGVVNKEELWGLSDWLAEHDHLRSRWPFDEIDSLLTETLKDGIIDPQEHKLLLEFFADISGEGNLGQDGIDRQYTLMGICAVSPQITVPSSIFCFTGASQRYTRDELWDMVIKHGGFIEKGVNKKINYLVVGAEGNQCWKYSCYGLKIEQAVKLRQKGHNLLIVHENDFHDALA